MKKPAQRIFWVILTIMVIFSMLIWTVGAIFNF